jgi:carboxypeptidase Q
LESRHHRSVVPLHRPPGSLFRIFPGLHPMAALLVMVLVTVLLAGCETTDAPDTGLPGGVELEDAGLEWVVALGLAESRVEANADTLLDRIGARISALPSGDSAQAFVRRQMEAFGVDHVREEPFDLLAWDRREAVLEVVEPAGEVPGALNILSLGHVGSHDLEAPLLDAGFGTAEEIEALGERVAGAIVLVDVSSPPGYGRGVHRTEKVTLATRAGALGFIQVNDSEGPLVPVGVATMGDEATEIPAVAADHATGIRLREALQAHSEVRVRLMVDNWMERTTAANVLGDLEGETDEVVLVGAHLDSWDLATGALDNGSGSLAVLDIARTLAAHVRATGERPRRTIRFAFWMGEELGLYGSRAHVDRRVEDGSLDRYVAVLNLDVVSAPVALGAMGRTGPAPLLRQVREAAGEAGIELSEEFTTGGGLYSDHQPFLLQGIPIVTLASRHRPEAAGTGHTIADTREILHEPGIARTAAVSSALLWALANAPELGATMGMERWSEEEIGGHLERLGVRDPLERGGEWRWP